RCSDAILCAQMYGSFTGSRSRLPLPGIPLLPLAWIRYRGVIRPSEPSWPFWFAHPGVFCLIRGVAQRHVLEIRAEGREKLLDPTRAIRSHTANMRGSRSTRPL